MSESSCSSDASSQKSISRDPPEGVKRALRQEVRFACPVPDCANPILTWHHFDPPWNEKHHHNPEGMIALCIRCHRLADGGNWERSDLHRFKRNPPHRESVRNTFLWSESAVLYRLGGSYAADCRYIISVSGVPLLWHTASPDGRLLFSLVLLDEKDNRLLFLDENSLSVEYAQLHDLTINTYENHLKVWTAKQRIGLDLHLRHLSVTELAAQLEKDASRALKTVSKLLRPGACANLPAGLQAQILTYAEERCLNADKQVAVLDIVNATLFAEGRRAVVRNGIVSSSEFRFCFSSNNGGAAYAL